MSRAGHAQEEPCRIGCILAGGSGFGPVLYDIWSRLVRVAGGGVAGGISGIIQQEDASLEIIVFLQFGSFS